MDPLPFAYKHVNSILMRLEGEWWANIALNSDDDQNLKQQIEILKLDLKFMKTLLTFLDDCDDYWRNLSHLDQFLSYLGVQLNDAEAPIYRLRAAASDQQAKLSVSVSLNLYATNVVSDLGKKIKSQRPAAKVAYNCILNCSVESRSSLRTCFGFKFFVQDLQHNISDLCICPVGLNLPLALIEQLKSLLEDLKLFESFISSFNGYSGPFKDFFTYFGAAVFRASHVCYLCWVEDKRDEGFGLKMVIMLSDVQKILKFNSTKAIDLLLMLLTSSKSTDAEKMIPAFISLLVPSTGDRIRKGLDFLLKLFTRAPDLYKEDVTLVLMHITSVFTDVESLNNSFNNRDLVLLMLVELMELFKTEALLKELLNQRAGLVVPVKDQIDSVIEGISFLGTYDFQDLPEAKTEGSKVFWMHIEEVVREIGSLHHLFHAKEVTEDRFKDSLLKLLDKIKLFKVEAFLKMLLISGKPSLILPDKDIIKNLYEDMIFLRTFVMLPLVENNKISVESIARDAGLFYYSIYSCEIKEEAARKMNCLLPDMLEKIMLFKEEVRKIYDGFQSFVQSNFPTTHGLDFVDFILGNLGELLNHKVDAIASLKHHYEFFYTEMKIFRCFLEDISGQIYVHSELKNLHSRILGLANQAEYLIDSFVVKGAASWCHVQWLSDLVEEIKLSKIHITEITERKTNSINADKASQALRSAILPVITPSINDVVLDLPDQAGLVIDRLTQGTLQQDIVAIVGMPGLGKTTLVKKVYDEPSIMYHFDIRAWAYVSQAYQKRKLLIDILSDIKIQHSNFLVEMSDEDLDLELYQCLKGRKYLIVMDDMWSTEDWNDVERSFPDDQNGSRILITSRYHDVALNAKSNSDAHHLRQLTDDESWELLLKKLLDTEEFPEELVEVGQQIAKNCEGLPLAVVVIAGLLKGTYRLDWWKQVAESLTSLCVGDPQTKCMDILDLSFKHLPDYLKQCFLYLGSFLENKEIPVAKLKSLWIAEGLVQNSETQSLEDIAEKYLIDLVDRNLVMVSKIPSRSSGIKACRVHDMLRYLCFAKCKEENFSQVITGSDELYTSSYENLDYGVDPDYKYPSNAITYDKRRLFICSKRNHFVMSRPSGKHARSLLFFAKSDSYPTCPYDVSFICENFKLLRVLDLECINMGNAFPRGIELLVHLRYLAVSGDINVIPSSIENLWNLETFLVKGLRGKVVLPESIWSMKRLRHVHVDNHAAFRLQDDKRENLFQLDYLVSLSSPALSYGKDTTKILKRFPNLQKLGCMFSESREDIGQPNRYPVLEFLTKLESLKIFYSCRNPYLGKFEFPINLKKLTLSNFRVPWENISEIGKLPKLEVLKLLSKAFEGKTWDMREEEFQELKFLKLDSLNIAEWSALSDHLPKLQRLVLRNCKQLEEVPSGFANIATLEMIEVQFCKRSTEESVKRLKEDFQKLKVVINLSECN